MGGIVSIDDFLVPANTMSTLARYVIHHIKPGSFTEAVLLNHLYGAVIKADHTSMRYLKNIVQLVYFNCPMSIMGESGYSRWLQNDDPTWHTEIQKRYGEWWKPYLAIE